eukprot:663843-Alexandrium_andersonii.AAC.1
MEWRSIGFPARNSQVMISSLRVYTQALRLGISRGIKSGHLKLGIGHAWSYHRNPGIAQLVG